jgi:hypothetical protein
MMVLVPGSDLVSNQITTGGFAESKKIGEPAPVSDELLCSELAIARPQNTVVGEISQKIRNPAISSSLREALEITDRMSD